MKQITRTTANVAFLLGWGMTTVLACIGAFAESIIFMAAALGTAMLATVFGHDNDLGKPSDDRA